jgi:molybdate transport system regulatory protein
MKLSTRNQLAGTVRAVNHGSVMSTIKVELAGGDVITSAITKEAAEDLAVEPGSAVTVLIKSTEVMLAVD